MTEGGLQRQRTELAWRRTVTACWLVSLIVLHYAFPPGVFSSGAFLYGMGAAAIPLAMTLVAYARRTRLRRLDGPPPPLSRPYGFIVAVLCVLTLATVGVVATG